MFKSSLSKVLANFVCKGTQEDQNKVDDEKRRQAMKELVGSWMERLQLISLIVS